MCPASRRSISACNGGNRRTGPDERAEGKQITTCDVRYRGAVRLQRAFNRPSVPVWRLLPKQQLANSSSVQKSVELDSVRSFNVCENFRIPRKTLTLPRHGVYGDR